MKESSVFQEKKRIAHSYVRFSTAKQELGDSERRQVELAERYCAEEGLTLHPLRYNDLGVSAFKRKNQTLVHWLRRMALALQKIGPWFWAIIREDDLFGYSNGPYAKHVWQTRCS